VLSSTFKAPAAPPRAVDVTDRGQLHITPT
jgi:hypothetical protein